MFRKVISEGDLIVERRYWWSLGKFIPYRNLSEEVRCLTDLEEAALEKFKSLHFSRVVAEGNVKHDMDTLQMYLLDNSKVSWYSDIEQSILEKREGVKYSDRSNNNKKGSSSSNKDQQGQKKPETGGKGKEVSLMDVLLKSKITLH